MRKFLFLLLLLAACKKKEVTCDQTAVLIPQYIGFYGFNKDDLDTIQVSKYIADSSFSTLIKSDTLINANIYQENGHLYPDNNKAPFTSIDENADIIISLPSLSKTYHLHAIYSPAYTTVWTEETSCGPTGAFVQGPDSIFINNVTYRDTAYSHWLYIKP